MLTAWLPSLRMSHFALPFSELSPSGRLSPHTDSVLTGGSFPGCCPVGSGPSSRLPRARVSPSLPVLLWPQRFVPASPWFWWPRDLCFDIDRNQHENTPGWRGTCCSCARGISSSLSVPPEQVLDGGWGLQGFFLLLGLWEERLSQSQRWGLAGAAPTGSSGLR